VIAISKVRQYIDLAEYAKETAWKVYRIRNGRRFALSAVRTLNMIIDNITKADDVTKRQMSAIDNINQGLNKWIRRRGKTPHQLKGGL